MTLSELDFRVTCIDASDAAFELSIMSTGAAMDAVDMESFMYTYRGTMRVDDGDVDEIDLSESPVFVLSEPTSDRTVTVQPDSVESTCVGRLVVDFGSYDGEHLFSKMMWGIPSDDSG